MIFLIIILTLVYLAIALWVAFVGLVAGGIPVLGVEVKNTTILLIVVFLSSLFWPLLLLTPIATSVFKFFKSYFV